MTDNNNKENQLLKGHNIPRTYIIGDKWLYFKFYTGPKTADVILSQVIKPLSEQLLNSGAIDKWFYIRYADPKVHTRVRFSLNPQQPDALLQVVRAVNIMTRPYLQQDLVWKIQVDSYQPEIERYGPQTMDVSETIFFQDSRMMVDMLDMIEGDEGERIRWLFGLRAIDSLLDDFQYNMEGKYELVTRLREGFGREFGMNRALKEQFEAKFRRDRKEISKLMDRSQDTESLMLPLFQLIARKSQVVAPIAAEILKIYNNEKPNPLLLNDFFGSHSHMLVNRLFKSKQRLQELTLYDFLHRYYKSEIARKKYAGINKQKKSKKKKKEKS